MPSKGAEQLAVDQPVPSADVVSAPLAGVGVGLGGWNMLDNLLKC
jgi:hypothetical protein